MSKVPPDDLSPYTRILEFMRSKGYEKVTVELLPTGASRIAIPGEIIYILPPKDANG